MTRCFCLQWPAAGSKCFQGSATQSACSFGRARACLALVYLLSFVLSCFMGHVGPLFILFYFDHRFTMAHRHCLGCHLALNYLDSLYLLHPFALLVCVLQG
jgi:hypothetical protein